MTPIKILVLSKLSFAKYFICYLSYCYEVIKGKMLWNFMIMALNCVKSAPMILTISINPGHVL